MTLETAQPSSRLLGLLEVEFRRPRFSSLRYKFDLDASHDSEKALHRRSSGLLENLTWISAHRLVACQLSRAPAPKLYGHSMCSLKTAPSQVWKGCARWIQLERIVLVVRYS